MGKYSKKIISRKNLSLKEILRLFIEISGEDSAKKAKVNKYFADNFLTWMIYKWRIEILGNMNVSGQFTIRTWASGYEKISSFREFEIIKDEKILAKASTVFVIVNTKGKKLSAIPKIVTDFYLVLNERNFEDFPRFKAKGKILNEISHEVLKEEIDNNHHVNNFYYIEWILKALPKSYKKEKIKEINITYMKEILYPNTLKITAFEGENRLYFSIKSEDYNARAFLSFYN